jgi:hypothetical protein
MAFLDESLALPTLEAQISSLRCLARDWNPDPVVEAVVAEETRPSAWGILRIRPPSAILQVTGLSPACTKFQSRLPKTNKYAFCNRPHLPSPTPATSTHLPDVTSERFTRVLSRGALADSLSWYVFLSVSEGRTRSTPSPMIGLFIPLFIVASYAQWKKMSMGRKINLVNAFTTIFFGISITAVSNFRRGRAFSRGLSLTNDKIALGSRRAQADLGGSVPTARRDHRPVLLTSLRRGGSSSRCPSPSRTRGW